VKQRVNVVLILLLLMFLMPFVDAYLLSYIFDIPYWYLRPYFFPFSVVPILRKLKVTVEPSVPLVIGEKISIKVVDALNGTPIEYAKVIISKDNEFSIDLYTDKNGTVTFDYLGEITIIKVTKEGYHMVVKVIPKIPDRWIRTLLYKKLFNSSTYVIGIIYILIRYRAVLRISFNTKKDF